MLLANYMHMAQQHVLSSSRDFHHAGGHSSILGAHGLAAVNLD